GGRRALVALDGGGDAADQLALQLLAQVPLLLGVGDAVAEDLVAARAQPGRDVRALVVHRGVHLRLDGEAELVEQLEQPPHADAVAVVAPAVHAVARRLVGRRDGRALADAEAERLDVHRHVDGEAAAARPRVVGPRDDAGVAVAVVSGKHAGPPRGRCGAGRRRTRPRVDQHPGT